MTMSIYTNHSAASCRLSTSLSSSSSTEAAKLHSQLPSYAPTPLVALSPSLTRELGLKNVFVKCETSRFGLPAFKILGASYAVFRALCRELELPHNSTTLEQLKAAVRQRSESKKIKLTAATDGNFGRAMARMAALLSVQICEIYVPLVMDAATQQRIKSENTTDTDVCVVVVNGDYDAAVDAAAAAGGIHIQDNAFREYTEVPAWVSQGYSTLFEEVEAQLPDGAGIDAAVCPVGVGSLAHAVVAHYKREGRCKDTAVITVEPTAAPCLNASLRAGEMVTVETTDTIMAGMNCGTVSTIAWPLLKEAVSVSVTVSDRQAHEAVQELGREGINAGPCGAAALAGLVTLVASEEGKNAAKLGERSSVLLICTEGRRDYENPN